MLRPKNIETIPKDIDKETITILYIKFLIFNTLAILSLLDLF